MLPFFARYLNQKSDLNHRLAHRMLLPSFGHDEFPANAVDKPTKRLLDNNNPPVKCLVNAVVSIGRCNTQLEPILH